MEASAAALGGADTGEAQDEAQEAPNYATRESVDAIAQSQGEVRDLLRQMQEFQQQQAAPVEEDEAVDWEALLGDEALQDPRVYGQRLEEVINQQVEQRLKPLQEDNERTRQETDTVKRMLQMDQLTKEFPELEDPQKTQELLQATQGIVSTFDLPPQYAEQLASDPGYLKQTLLAIRGIEAAQEEDAESSPAAHLEGGNGARPGLSNEDLAEQAFPAGQRQRLFNF